MYKSMKLALFTAAVSAAVCATPTLAQQAQPSRFRGSVTAFKPPLLKLRSRDGKDVNIMLGKKTQVNSVALTGVGAIKPDSYIGTAAVPQPDGSLRALEVHVFPASMRGVGEGSKPWDLKPKSTMTNGRVGKIVVSKGRMLTVKYANGEKRIYVPADVPIVNIAPGNPSLLVPGAKVLVVASKGKNGAWSAHMVSVGKNGITPPM